MPAKLTLFPSRGASRSFVFREGRNHFLGRDPSSDLVLDDPRVSGRHALFQWTGNDWILVDLRSKNGTQVNGSPITELPLQGGDWLSFGGLVARLGRLSEEDVQSLLAQRAGRLQAFVRSRRELEAEREPRLAMRRLTEAAVADSGAQRGLLLLFAASGKIEAEVAVGFPPFERIDERFDDALAALEEVWTTGLPVVLSNLLPVARPTGPRAMGNGGARALACVPIRAERRTTGLLFVDRATETGVFTDVDLEILESFAEYASQALGSRNLDRPIREMVGGPGTAAQGRTFLDELEDRVQDILRAARATLPNP